MATDRMHRRCSTFGEIEVSVRERGLFFFFHSIRQERQRKSSAASLEREVIYRCHICQQPKLPRVRIDCLSGNRKKGGGGGEKKH